MRQKNIVKIGIAFLVSILFSGLLLLVKGANIQTFAQGDQDSTIVQLLQLSNSLENQYEEINTALRFQVNGVREVERNSISELVKTQENLGTEWTQFKSDFCQQDTNNCIYDNNEDLAQRINNNIESLKNIQPLFAKHKETIPPIEQYQQYINYLGELNNHNEEQEEKTAQGDSLATTNPPPENPITPNETVKNIQAFIKRDLENNKTEQNSAQIDKLIKKIEKESGIFFRQTQAWVTKFSTEKSRSLENDLLKINERFLTLNGGAGSIYPNNIQNIFIAIIGILTLIVIVVLIFLCCQNPELFRKNRISDQIANQFSTLYERSIQDNQESQHRFLQGLRRIESNNVEAYKEVSRNNNKTSENVTQLLTNNNELLANNNKLIENIINKNPIIQEGTVPEKENTQIANEEVEKESFKISNLNTNQIGNILSTLRNSDKLEDLVNNYNHKTINKSDIVKVSATRESIEKRRTGDNTPLILIQENEGNEATWVVNQYRLQDNCYFLVPKSGLIINDRIYQTIEDIFMCQGYKNRASNDFKLMLPAIVKSRSNNEWELVEPGELLFEEKGML